MERYLDEAERQQARDLLQELLERLPTQTPGACSLPAAWRSFAEEWARIENIEGVFVYQANLGGWHFDIELRDVPTGCPKILGSPLARPYRQQNEALEAATEMLGCFSRRHEGRIASGEVDLWFRLHDCDVALPQLLFEFARSEQILRPMDSDEADIRLTNQLEAFGLAANPEPATAVMSAVKTLAPEDRCALIASLCRAHAAGIFQFPAARCLSPSGHTAHITPQ